MFIHSKKLIASATAIISILPQLAIAPQCTYAVETTAVGLRRRMQNGTQTLSVLMLLSVMQPPVMPHSLRLMQN